AIGMTTSYVLTGRRLLAAEVPMWPVYVAIASGIVGIFVIPFLGLPLGSLLGLYLSEAVRQKDWGRRAPLAPPPVTRTLVGTDPAGSRAAEGLAQGPHLRLDRDEGPRPRHPHRVLPRHALHDRLRGRRRRPLRLRMTRTDTASRPRPADAPTARRAPAPDPAL